MTLEIPLGHIDHSEFTQLVVNQNVRPERPDDADSLGLSDELWELAEQCWVKEPLNRPSASIVCDDMKSFLHTPPLVTHVPSMNYFATSPSDLSVQSSQATLPGRDVATEPTLVQAVPSYGRSSPESHPQVIAAEQNPRKSSPDRGRPIYQTPTLVHTSRSYSPRSRSRSPESHGDVHVSSTTYTVMPF